jgi:hypothetical protein
VLIGKFKKDFLKMVYAMMQMLRTFMPSLDEIFTSFSEFLNVFPFSNKGLRTPPSRIIWF